MYKPHPWFTYKFCLSLDECWGLICFTGYKRKECRPEVLFSFSNILLSNEGNLYKRPSYKWGKGSFFGITP